MTEREFEKCIDRYNRLLWKVASSVLEGIGSAQDVEECVADVFIELWQKPEAFDGSRGSLRNYLCLKCRSRAIDRFRSLSAQVTEELNEEKLRTMADTSAGWPPEADAGDMGSGEPSVAHEARLDALRSAVDRLDEPAREIMIRRFYMGQKPSQIAAATGLAVRKVENTIYRSKEKLRAELAGTDEMSGGNYGI